MKIVIVVVAVLVSMLAGSTIRRKKLYDLRPIWRAMISRFPRLKAAKRGSRTSPTRCL